MINLKELVKMFTNKLIFLCLFLLGSTNCYNIRGNVYNVAQSQKNNITFRCRIDPSYKDSTSTIKIRKEPYKICVFIESDKNILNDLKVLEVNVVDNINGASIVNITNPEMRNITESSKYKYRKIICVGKIVDNYYSVNMPLNDIGIRLKVQYKTEETIVNMVGKHQILNLWKSRILTHLFEG